MTTSPSSITSRSEDKKGWEFADFAECLSWHDKNSTFQGSTVDSGYKGMLNRGNSGYRGQFAADQNFYLIKAGQIEEKGAF